MARFPTIPRPPMKGLHAAAMVALVAPLALGATGCGAPSGEEAGPASESQDEGALSVAETLGGGAQEGFLRADTVRPFAFPMDHGPHPGFRNEWWYFTGSLADEAGQPFGFQLTLFRTELAPPPQVAASDPASDAASDAAPDSASRWTTRVAWMGHLAVTSGPDGDHRAEERFAREALGLAGAEADPLAVWLEDWRIEEVATDLSPNGGLGRVRLTAAQGQIGIDLELEGGSRIYRQGDRGLSQKGPEAGNASYYYSIPRMRTSGTVRFAGREAAVEGESWLDREWSTSALSPGVVGWDWFSLQLSDGWSLMLYDLRREDGSVTEFSKAVFMGPDGESIPVSRDEVGLEVLGSWPSPVDGALYPSGWRLTIPGHGVDLEVDPLMADQEMDLTFRYWEGAVRARGQGMTGPVTGTGYVELTGYAGVVPEAR